MNDQEKQQPKAAPPRRAGRKRLILSGFLLSLLTVVCLMIAMLLPVMEVTGDSMSPTLPAGSLVLTIKTA